MILRFNIFFQDSTLELPILEHERPWDEPWGWPGMHSLSCWLPHPARLLASQHIFSSS